MSFFSIVSSSQLVTLFVNPCILVPLVSVLLFDLGDERSGAFSKLYGLELAGFLDCLHLGLLPLDRRSEQEFAVNTSRIFEDAVLDRPVQSSCLLLDLIADELLGIVVEEVLRAEE
jgi:hypothetical protein